MFDCFPPRLRCAPFCCSFAALLLASHVWLSASATEKAETARSRGREKPPESQQPKPPAKSAAVADQTSKPDLSGSDYVRIRKNSRRLAVALETAVITLSDSPKYHGATVDLIGAIHLGEREYYEKLNSQFRKYDACGPTSNMGETDRKSVV